MRSIALILVATALALATDTGSFAGEVGETQPGCPSTCTTCEFLAASPTSMQGIGPKGGPIGKQIITPYLGSQSAVYLAPIPGVISAGPIAGSKGSLQRGTTAGTVPGAAETINKFEACKAEVRESMRGPKGGYRVPKGTSYYAIEHKITEACRRACAE